MQIPKWSGNGEPQDGEGDKEGGEEGGEEAEEGAEGGEREKPEAEEEDPMAGFVVPLNARTMHEKELEAEVVGRRRGLEQRLPALIAEANELIQDPVKKIPVEPSQFEPPVLQWLIRDSPQD